MGKRVNITMNPNLQIRIQLKAIKNIHMKETIQHL